MRDFWTFIGGVAVGILAVTGVYALEEDEEHRPFEPDKNMVDELEEETEKEADDEGRLIVRAS
ncbi:hypothetical protein [Pseudodesulfovibrio portus]|uniref:Uncharacterized protein n=1 Tax=Pseudodesulfovibrio portus TaxID=231439 RepID=A0ABM8AU22_9BACT|nr:hypothetical protein [Pseudodesulfovibrio portus]BDQ34745.1 hypothetical protein JCM14722_22870 [Pseudodesulfovibrio portus]